MDQRGEKGERERHEGAACVRPQRDPQRDAMHRALDRGPPPSVTLTTPEAVPAAVPSDYPDAVAADDDSQWRFSGATIPDDPQVRRGCP